MKKVQVLLLALVLMVMVGCSTHMHTVGNGPQTGVEQSATQWYLLYGLIPLNSVDTNTMAGDAADYQITTQTTAVDIVIGIPASWVTISRRTVTVTK